MCEFVSKTKKTYTDWLVEKDPEERAKIANAGLTIFLDGVGEMADSVAEVKASVAKGEADHAEIKRLLAERGPGSGGAWLAGLGEWWSRRGLVTRAAIVIGLLFLLPPQAVAFMRDHLADITELLRAIGAAKGAAVDVVGK